MPGPPESSDPLTVARGGTVSSRERPIQRCRRVTLTEVTFTAGEGTPDSLVRQVVAYYDDDGRCVAVNDIAILLDAEEQV